MSAFFSLCDFGNYDGSVLIVNPIDNAEVAYTDAIRTISYSLVAEVLL